MATARMFLTSMAIVVGLVSAARAEVAASIHYNFIERPASLPADFAPSGGTSLRTGAVAGTLRPRCSLVAQPAVLAINQCGLSPFAHRCNPPSDIVQPGKLECRVVWRTLPIVDTDR